MVAKGARTSLGLGGLDLHLSVGTAVLIAFLLAVLRAALQGLIAWLPTKMAADVQAQLRRELVDAFSSASWSVKANEPEGHFQELVTNQTSQAMNAVLSLATAISSAALFLALLASAFSLSLPVASLVLLSSVVLFLAFRPLNKVGRSAARDASQAYINLAGGISEAVRLAEEAEVFGAGEVYRSRASKLIDTARNGFFRQLLTARLVGSLYQSAIYLIIVGGIGALYLGHVGDLAALGAVILIMVRASSYGQQFQGSVLGLIQVMPYVERLYDTIGRYQASAHVEGDLPMPPVRQLAFDHVSFWYSPGQTVLHDTSFEVAAGETIGIIGPTGAGKSTVSQILLRLRDPVTGAYLVNGTPVGQFSRDDWQRRVAYVPQEPRIYSATVAENIRFFRDIDQARIEHAARLAHVHNDITSMPSAYATMIGQQADAISGGQRQRICLARALVGRPEILLLDEPTSALDLTSEAAVEASLADLHGQMTIFIIAHRLSVLHVCDRVLVLEHGRVTAFGPIAQLALDSDFYQRVAVLAGRHIPTHKPIPRDATSPGTVPSL